MKKLLITVGLAALVSSASAQGLVNFFNSPTTLVTLRDSSGANIGPTPAVAGQYYFQLFIAPAGTVTDAGFTATAMATNLASAGRLTGGGNVGIPGAPAGGTRAILVRGWSASYGLDYQAAWTAHNAGGTGYLGTSAIAPNFIFGGFDGVGTIPTSPAFGGVNGIQQGFELVMQIPEPSSMALAGLGAVSLLIFRRRK